MTSPPELQAVTDTPDTADLYTLEERRLLLESEGRPQPEDGARPRPAGKK